MEDLLVELLLELAGVIIEAIFEYVLIALFDLLSRALTEVFAPAALREGLPASAGYASIGLVLGFLSLLVFPHPLVHPSRIHGINLLVSPVIAGLMMSWMGSAFRRQDKNVTLLESFGYGFAFAFGIALVRFLFAK